MKFQPGNKLWELRAKDGKEPLYKPDELWSRAIQYFEWISENPLMETQLFSYQGIVIEKEVPKMRAMTFQGLELFLDIAHGTWVNYKNKTDYLTITTRIEKVIYEQKFTGAAATLFHPNIIARDLGLRDNQDVTSGGERFHQIQFSVISKDDLDNLEKISDNN